MKKTLTIMALLSITTCASAQQTLGKPETARTQVNQTHVNYSQLDDREKLLAQIWNLSNEEMVRAKVLLEGPRKTFSVPNLSPVEALGIHARTDAERRKYAEAFARALHQDVERSLAWNNAFAEAMQRMYPNEAVVDYSGVPKSNASIGAADALGIPRSVINQAAPSSSVPRR